MIATNRQGKKHLFVDRTGHKYGRLLVVRPEPSKEDGVIRWFCQCECGNTIAVRQNNLQNGNTKSCGCLRSRLPRGESAFNQIFYRMGYNATSRSHDFDLTKDQVRQLVVQPCHYCGSPPGQEQKGCNGNFLYNGIDRVDNSVGYVEGNVVACCGQCNRAKGILGVDEFKAWIVRAYEHSIKGQRE